MLKQCDMTILPLTKKKGYINQTSRWMSMR
jgi:hypothetical protein